MILQEKEGVEWLEFELLRPFSHIAHGVFLRKEGGSGGSCFSFTAHNQEDFSQNIEANRDKLRSCLRLPTLVTTQQRHLDQIVEVDIESSSKDIRVPVAHADALFTKRRNMGLAIYHADCQAALFYDPKKEIIANVHCGWRGNVQNILGKTVTTLQKAGCHPEDLLVCISPSLGPDHAQFIHYKEELPEAFYPYQKTPAYFDLWAISEAQLLAAGVLPHHIEIARLCTYTHEELFFSYRRDKTTGRNATVIGFR